MANKFTCFFQSDFRNNVLQKGIFFLVLFVTFIPNIYATHNRAGEISISQVGDCTSSLTIKATITTYTKTSSIQADRDTLFICWGDGKCEKVGRSNGGGSVPKGEPLENDTKRNIYIAYHTFPSRGTYVISTTDPNRNGGILNVNYPNSEQIRFHIQTTYSFPNPQFQGCNNTPVLLQPPIDIGCVGQKFIHNPNAYDSDGDSLSYHFSVPLQDVGLAVPNYIFPSNISPGPKNNLTLNAVTGDIVWDAPQRAGEYNLSIIIVEYRDGFPIDTIIRDMQILIKNCDNLPPEIKVPFDEICVIAGETLRFEVTATAPLTETNQRVKLTALGGPFVVQPSPASFLPPGRFFEPDPVTKVFTWKTSCEHISEQYYSVVFKAQDNFFPDSSGLAILKTVRIKVVGPPPKDLQIKSNPQSILLSWGKPYACDTVGGNYFRGFTVWRKVNTSQFPLDTCQPGLAGKGYTQLNDFSIINIQNNRYVYEDKAIESGKTYCYRILAEFARTTPNGRYAYNLVESLPSEEICIQLGRDLPLPIEVNVKKTAVNGLMKICWIRPKADVLDTINNPPPYTFVLTRGIGNNPATFSEIWRSTPALSFSALRDTCFEDASVDTEKNAYSYKITLVTGPNNRIQGTTNPTSSVFLTGSGSDKSSLLSWNFQTTWENYGFTIYRKNNAGVFDSIGFTNLKTFTDGNLTNGRSYCYLIKSWGTYGVAGLPDPINNFSQEICVTPRDNVPPCPPVLKVNNFCETGNYPDCDEIASTGNELNWSKTQGCNDTDIAGYYLYYSPGVGKPEEKVKTITGANVSSTRHTPKNGLAGCYRLTAFDINGNESKPSSKVCSVNCPVYDLPNAFTPNDDGNNDFFKPRKSCFIASVDFKVFNRWGQLVFQTTDPAINWNGNQLQGQKLPSGTYYYVCKVFENGTDGLVPFGGNLSGYIELQNGND